MKRVLYVDACMRAESRTEELAAAYIRQVFSEDICSVQRIRVADLDLAPMSGEDVAARDAELAAGCKADLHYNGGRPAAQGSVREAVLGRTLRNVWH